MYAIRSYYGICDVKIRYDGKTVNTTGMSVLLPNAVMYVTVGVDNEAVIKSYNDRITSYNVCYTKLLRQRPTLVLAHNKTLAAQLCSEFREFFPDNAVEFFVSYYDYYQPEAYVPGKDLYIEKDSSINDEIDRLRHSATSSLLERKDVIVVASVSCIYSIA